MFDKKAGVMSGILGRMKADTPKNRYNDVQLESINVRSCQLRENSSKEQSIDKLNRLFSRRAQAYINMNKVNLMGKVSQLPQINVSNSM
jgi:hypothetical protein